MSMLLLFPIAIPFLCGIVMTLRPALSEGAASRMAGWASALMAAVVGFLAIYLGVQSSIGGRPLVFESVVFRSGDYEFNFSLFLDWTGLVFLVMVALLGGLVIRFSHYYMHRESGQTRFFATLMFFLSGMALLALSESLNTFFLGWEVVGIASYLLIAFYRTQEEPIRNALRVYSIYRLCDVGLLCGAYLEHHSLHSGFRQLAEVTNSDLFRQMGEPGLFGLSALLLLAAAGKSAQFPFSFWLPRAMVGPTPSSAIFYGALSVHAGVLLLIRTGPIWQASTFAPWMVGGLGALTALLATVSGRVQSNIKSQIAYASITQVGLMFVELALGFPKLALLHFVGNASIRCYQLLVSPSVVVYLLKAQSTATGGLGARLADHSFRRLLPPFASASLYALGSAEGYLEGMIRSIFWKLPHRMSRILHQRAFVVYPLLGASFLFGVDRVAILVICSTFMSLQCFGSRNGLQVFTLVWVSSVMLASAIALGSHQDLANFLPFLGGISAGFGLALFGLFKLPRVEKRWRIDLHSGRATGHPLSARCAFIGMLAMVGFPVSPAFFGEDLLLKSSIAVHPSVAAIFTLIFILNGIALVRAFTRLYFGSEYSRPPTLHPSPSQFVPAVQPSTELVSHANTSP